MIYFFPWSTIWTEHRCQTRHFLFFFFVAGFCVLGSNRRADPASKPQLPSWKRAGLISKATKLNAQNHHQQAEGGLSLSDMLAYFCPARRETINNLFTRPLEWLKEHVCCCRWGKNPYTLLWNQTSRAPCARVPPGEPTCRAVGKIGKNQNDGWLAGRRPPPVSHRSVSFCSRRVSGSADC